MTMKVAIYSRVSHLLQAEKGSSIENQMDQLKAFCSAKGWEIAGQYTDSGVSGRNFKRPAFQSMLDDLSPKGIEGIVVYSVSRFGRNTKDALTLIQSLQDRGVSFYTMDLGIDTTTPHGSMILTIMSAFAQFESDQTGERIRAVQGNRKNKKETYCGHPPLGYDNSEGKMVENQKEMQIVKYIFHLKNNGETASRIATLLNKEGYNGKKKGRFQTTTIKKVLKNSIYNDIR